MLDTFPRRCMFNEWLRTWAQAQSGVVLADAEAAFEQASPQGFTGNGLFYDAVHLLFQGNHLLAKAFFESVSEALLQRGLISQTSSCWDADTCAQKMGLTEFLERRHLELALEELQVSKLLDERVDLTWVSTKIQGLPAGPETMAAAAERLREAVTKTLPGDPYRWRALVNFYVRAGDGPSALQAAREAVQRFPLRTDLMLLLANLTEQYEGQEKAAEIRQRLWVEH